MLASLFFTILVAQAVPTTAPQGTAPPVIIDVHSKNSLCSALEHDIGPSVAGLMQNDSAIMHGLSTLGIVKGHDRSLGVDIKNLRLEYDVSSIVRNLGKVDQLLQPSPPHPHVDPSEAEKIETMKKALRDVARAQLMSLNLLDGALETRQLGQMMDLSDIPNFVEDYAPASMNAALAHAPDSVATAASNPDASHAVTPSDFFPDIRRSEDRANRIIVATAASCAPVNHALAP